MTAILIDTNVLVYAHDAAEPAKHEQAIQVLDHLAVTGSGRLSVQCLAEFFGVVTRGVSPRLTALEASQQVERLVRAWPTHPLTPLIVLEATRGVREYRLAHWDAQLWATARLNQIPVIFSEDFNVGSTLEGVRFVSPFAPDFEVDAWS